MQYPQHNNYLRRSRREPNCLKCKHYFVTWKPRQPRGCHLFGFEGRQMPCRTVKRITGHECPGFEPK